MTPQEAAEQYVKGIVEFGKDLRDVHLRILARKDFEEGAKWQSEQDNQALSSALKEIEELRVKVNRLLMSIDELEDDNTNLEDTCIRLKVEVIKLQNSNGLSPESHPKPDSANLPPESAS